MLSTAKHVVEGLSSFGEHIKEAINFLKKRFDRPRLLHQADVHAILDAPAPKEESGKELRRLHDVVTQHLRALKAMEYERPGAFITSHVGVKVERHNHVCKGSVRTHHRFPISMRCWG